jgi:hypothetical protein
MIHLLVGFMDPTEAPAPACDAAKPCLGER